MKRARSEGRLANWIVIAATLAIAAAATFQHAMTLAWIGDDMVYRFIYDTLEPIRNFRDVMMSQASHYMNENGRLPAHVLVQSFAGIWGRTAFSIADALMMAGMLVLTVRFISMAPGLEKAREKSIIYVSVTILMMVFFPMPTVLYYSVSMSLNYLWACVLFVAMLLIFMAGRSDANSGWNKVVDTGGIIVAFLCGWWNEAFSVPASGGLLLYWIIRRDLNRRQKWMVVSLIIGTAILAFAPGTLMRAARMGASGGIKGSVMMLIDCYLDVTFIWILVMVAVITLVSPLRRNIRSFIRGNLLTVCILLVALVFSVYAHTYSHSLFLVEYLSMVLLIRIGWKMCRGLNNIGYWSIVAASLLMLIFAGFEYYAGVCDRQAWNEYREMEARYDISTDGVTWIETPRPDWWPIRECVADNGRQLPLPGEYWSREFAAYHGAEKKPTIILKKKDYRIFYSMIESRSVGETMKGTAEACEGDDFYLVKVPADEADTERTYMAYFDDDSFMAEMSPVRKAIYKLTGSRKAPKPLEYVELRGEWGRIDAIRKILSNPSRIELDSETAER